MILKTRRNITEKLFWRNTVLNLFTILNTHIPTYLFMYVLNTSKSIVASTIHILIYSMLISIKLK